MARASAPGSRALLQTLARASQPARIDLRFPSSRRLPFDFSPPSKWTTAVPASIATCFGPELITGKRQELYLQAFIDESYTRGEVKACNAQLAPLGRSLLRLAMDDLVTRVPSVGRATAVAFVESDETLGTVMSDVWKLSPLVLSDAGVEGLSSLFAPHQKADHARRHIVPLPMTATASRALVAAVYLNTDADTTARFVSDHVLRSALTIASA
jgi:dsRNA-specific ribonuclease